MNEKYLKTIREIGKVLTIAQIKSINEFPIEEANKIIGILISCEPKVKNQIYVDSYIKTLLKNGWIDPNKTGIKGKQPLSICCALYGLWSAALDLFNKGKVGEDKIKPTFFVNFSLDIIEAVEHGENNE